MKLNPCPICGHTPIVTSHSLDQGHGHGYPGCYTYHIKCSNINCPLSRDIPMFESDDIYRSKDDSYESLYETWNAETAKIDELILHRDD